MEDACVYAGILCGGYHGESTKPKMRMGIQRVHHQLVQNQRIQYFNMYIYIYTYRQFMMIPSTPQWFELKGDVYRATTGVK